MFVIRDFSEAIIHLDADAFFASVHQSVDLDLKGKPVVVGKERGVATAVSYEAKNIGVCRGMLIDDIRKKFPSVIILNSDYSLYWIFSSRIKKIIKEFSPLVEQYSIDEFFVDIKGLRRPLKKTYPEIALAIKNKVERELGITVSVGLSINKSLAKLASGFKKPSGFTVVPGRRIEDFLKKIPLQDIWGIGENTKSFLEKFGLKTAFDFACLNEAFIKKNLTKPFYEIWLELRGMRVFQLKIQTTKNKTIIRSGSFNKPTNDQNFIFSRLIFYIEEAFFEMRNQGLIARQIEIFLKTSEFRYFSKTIVFPYLINYPFFIHQDIKRAFEEIYKPNIYYRSCGCYLSFLERQIEHQLSIFEGQRDKNKEKAIGLVYSLIEKKRVDFGTILFDKERKAVFSCSSKKLKIPLIKVNLS